MASILSIDIQQSDAAAQTIANEYVREADAPVEGCNRLVEYLAGIAGGSFDASIRVNVEDDNGTFASATITCDQSAATANDVVSVGGTDLTAVSSSASTDEFLIGASDAVMATNLAAAINAQATLGQHLTATAAAAVVTVTSNRPGTIGNLITLVATVNSGTPFTFSSTELTGATGTGTATSRTYSLGE